MNSCVQKRTISQVSVILSRLTAEKKTGRKVQPVFITIDPERDSGKLMKDYVREFHPRMIGLRGSVEEVKKVAKLFRVYFMKTNDSKTDYLVDHSIIMVRALDASSARFCSVSNVGQHMLHLRFSKRPYESLRSKHSTTNKGTSLYPQLVIPQNAAVACRPLVAPGAATVYTAMFKCIHCL